MGCGKSWHSMKNLNLFSTAWMGNGLQLVINVTLEIRYETISKCITSVIKHPHSQMVWGLWGCGFHKFFIKFTESWIVLGILILLKSSLRVHVKLRLLMHKHFFFFFYCWLNWNLLSSRFRLIFRWFSVFVGQVQIGCFF